MKHSFELSEGRIISITGEELSRILPERQHGEISTFVDLAFIDPLYHGSHHHAVP